MDPKAREHRLLRLRSHPELETLDSKQANRPSHHIIYPIGLLGGVHVLDDEEIGCCHG